jgi:diacylglycerol O-acyltransferase / wax synthase
MEIDRANAADAMHLDIDRGTVPMHMGAILEFDPAMAPDEEMVRTFLGQAVWAVPRLRRILSRTPWGCGLPVWVDQPRFVPSQHLDTVSLTEPSDSEAIYAAAMDAVLLRLPRDRPLWRARIVVRPDGRTAALVLVLHHALADGIGGLAVLAAMADPSRSGPLARPGRSGQPTPPQPAPPRRALAQDAWTRRWHRLATLPDTLRDITGGARELGLRGISTVPPGSLLAPTGPRRRIDVVDCSVGALLERAHSAGVTLNDLVLVAVTGAVGRLLASRSDPLTRVVISVPVSGRSTTTAGRLGNDAGVMPVTVPTGVGPHARLAAVTAQRRRQLNGSSRGSSAHLLAPAFRLIAAAGAFQWFIQHQRLVHSFETNVRGPDHQLQLAGSAIRRIVPIAVNPGNVTFSFDVLSYAGRLAVTVVSDPDHVPDHQVLADGLQEELDLLVRGSW